MTETEALELLRQGKEIDEAARVLFGTWEGPFLGRFSHLTHDRHDAADIYQSACVYAVHHIGRYDAAQGSFYNWLVHIGLGYYKMMCRERKRARRCVDLLARSVPDSAAGPEELHDSLVRSEELWAKLHLLSFYELAATVLHWAEGLTYEEVGSKLGISPRMAKKYAWRGLHLLRLLYWLSSPGSRMAA